MLTSIAPTPEFPVHGIRSMINAMNKHLCRGCLKQVNTCGHVNHHEYITNLAARMVSFKSSGIMFNYRIIPMAYGYSVVIIDVDDSIVCTLQLHTFNVTVPKSIIIVRGWLHETQVQIQLKHDNSTAELQIHTMNSSPTIIDISNMTEEKYFQLSTVYDLPVKLDAIMNIQSPLGLNPNESFVFQSNMHCDITKNGLILDCVENFEQYCVELGRTGKYHE